MDPLVGTCMYILLLSIGVYLIFEGYLILWRKKIYVGPTVKIGLWLLKIIKGAEAEARKRAEFTSSKRMKASGYYFLIFGFFLLFFSIYNIYNLYLGAYL